MMGNSNGPLVGKVAVVTGSTSGIGKAIAFKLGKLGASVIIHGRCDSAHAQKTIADATAMGIETQSIFADLADHEMLPKLVEEAWNWKSQVSIWINNAGADVLTGKQAKLSFVEKMELLWHVDVRATLLLSRQVGKRMKTDFTQVDTAATKTGTVINMGWDQAEQGMEGESGELFSTTKGAIMSMTRSLAQSFAPEVRFNCVAPGWIKTEWGEQASAEWAARAKAQSLAKRWGTVDDVAEAVAFLCLPESNFINGQIIPVNGGFRFFPN